MKSNKLKKRLRKDRPMNIISLSFPHDVIEDLMSIAPLLGFSGYQPLIRAYVGQGLRADIERLETSSDLSSFIGSLRQQGVEDSVIASAMTGAKSGK